MASGPFRTPEKPIEPPEYVITTGLMCMELDGLGGRGWPAQIEVIMPTALGKWTLIDTYVERSELFPESQRYFFWTWKRAEPLPWRIEPTERPPLGMKRPP